MSFPAYEEYKDSGYFWLTNVPVTWDIRPVGSCFRERREKVSDTDYPALSVTKNGIVPQLENAAKTDDNDNRKCVIAGDFVINSRSDRKGSSGMASQDGSVSLINTVLTPNADLDIRFVHHLLRSVNFQEEFYRFGKGIVADLWSTNYSAMKGICIPVPPLPEQRTIAAFLDAETSKIDGLVSEQRRLIELLKEKRQAVISHAVTKGLNPDVKMKPSGIEWLGDVPEGWEVVKLAYAINAIGDVDHHMPPSVEDGVPYLMTGDLKELVSKVDFTKCKQVAQQDYRKLSRKIKTTRGDLIMAKYATVGSLSYVDLDIDFLVSYSCVTIKPNVEKAAGWFLFYCLKSDMFAYGIKRRINTNTQQNLGNDSLRQAKIVLPPLQVQHEIVRSLRDRVEKFDTLITQAERAIELLQERRTALISAAVTGKIDVRGYKPQEAVA
jgi:type I restriction enzyme S subunit